MSPCPNYVTKWIFTGEMYPRFTMILGGPIVDPAVFEHNSVKYSPFPTNNTSTPWSGIGVKLDYVMCEHWFIESVHGNIEQNFNHMIRNTLRHIVKLVAIKQRLFMDVISKPELRFNHECLHCENAVLYEGEFNVSQNATVCSREVQVDEAVCTSCIRGHINISRRVGHCSYFLLCTSSWESLRELVQFLPIQLRAS